MAPARRSPAPTSYPSVGTWRSETAVVGLRGAGTVDLTHFARTDTGHVRPLTRQEWVYVKKHGFAAIAPTFTDTELAAVIAYMEADVDRQEGRRLARR